MRILLSLIGLFVILKVVFEYSTAIKRKRWRVESAKKKELEDKENEKSNQLRIEKLKKTVQSANQSYDEEKKKGLKEIKKYHPDYSFQLSGEVVYFVDTVKKHSNYNGTATLWDKEDDGIGKWSQIISSNIFMDSPIAITSDKIFTLGSVIKGFVYDLDSLVNIERGYTIHEDVVELRKYKRCILE